MTIAYKIEADVAQLVVHVIGNDEVSSSILLIGSVISLQPFLSYTKNMRKLFLFLILSSLSIFSLSDSKWIAESLSNVETERADKERKDKENKEKKDKESILFLGDIMLGRYVEKIGNRDGFSSLFVHVAPLFASSTYVIGNLEGASPKIHEKTPSGGFRFSFNDDALRALSVHRITGVSLANNHTFDTGRNGYAETTQKLTELGIASFGHALFYKLDYITSVVNGVPISITGLNVITPEFKEADTISGLQKVCEEIGENPLLLFLHAGAEYRDMQSGYQVTLARKIIDETCVRTIIGSHPHVVQGIEKYKGRFIFYSLGNFIFDQYFSKETMEGFILKLEIKDGKFMFTLLPTVSKSSVPYLAEGDIKADILERIMKSSTEEIRSHIINGKVSE